jgi:hypothetical protein
MVIDARSSLTLRPSWRLVVVGAVVLLGLVGAARAQAAITDIQSSGPLTDIYIGDNLTCQVAHTGEADFQFYGPSSTAGSCGTFISVDNDASGPQLFGPGILGETPWTLVSQSPISGAGTAGNPFTVSTDEMATSDNIPSGLEAVETDSYVVGNEFYRTDIRLTNNNAEVVFSGRLYHAADCFLQGADAGYGFVDSSNGAVACTKTANNSPTGLIEEFAPLTPGSHHVESGFSSVWNDVRGQADLPDTCDCETFQDNGMGLNWDFSLAPGQSKVFSLLSNFSAAGVTVLPISATGGNSFSGQTGQPVGGTVATFSADSTDSAGDFAATIDWGDGTTSPGTISGTNPSFVVSGTHGYSTPGSYTITVTIVRTSNTANNGTATDSASIVSPTVVSPTTKPTVQGSSGSSSQSTAAGFSGDVNPGGLPTTAHFEYGLDSRYSSVGGSGPTYDLSTPSQSVGSDFSSHPVSASVSGLVPNALYHVRLVATNGAGTTLGPDLTFTTPMAPAPAPPALGKSFTGSATGLVLIEVNGKFVPVTQLSKIPNGAVINALHGTLTLNTAAPGGTQHAAFAAKKGKTKKPTKPKAQTGRFGGAVFKVTQAHSGQATLALVEGAKFKGAPTFASCKTKKGKAVAAALSKKTLQLLHGSAHGKFRTKGRYSAATIRGTIWTIADRCDGTLVHAIKDTVTVQDLVLHKTFPLRPGHSYLALAHPPKVKKKKTHK